MAFDVETTGLSPGNGHRVIEVGAIIMEGGKSVDEFSSLIKTPRNIPTIASQIHGITDEMLVGQPPPELVFPELKSFIGNRTLVAHNAPFDLSFLRYEFGRLGMSLPNPHLCTLEISRAHFPGLKNHKLETVYRHLMGLSRTYSGSPKGSERVPGTNRKQTHRALDDARMVAAIWLDMGNRR